MAWLVLLVWLFSGHVGEKRSDYKLFYRQKPRIYQYLKREIYEIKASKPNYYKCRKLQDIKSSMVIRIQRRRRDPKDAILILQPGQILLNLPKFCGSNKMNLGVTLSLNSLIIHKPIYHYSGLFKTRLSILQPNILTLSKNPILVYLKVTTDQ